MNATHRRLLAVLLALLVCCCLATSALAAGGSGPEATTAETTAVEDGAEKGYTLTEDIEIEDDETPLAAGVVETRCVLHVVLFLMTLAVAVCFLFIRQKHQARQRELLARLGR